MEGRKDVTAIFRSAIVLEMFCFTSQIRRQRMILNRNEQFEEETEQGPHKVQPKNVAASKVARRRESCDKIKKDRGARVDP